MELIKAGPTELEVCTDILYASKLGQTYYPTRELLRTELEKALAADCVYAGKTGG